MVVRDVRCDFHVGVMRITRNGNMLRLTGIAALTVRNSGRFRQKLQDNLQEGDFVEIEAGKLTMIDSSGLGALFALGTLGGPGKVTLLNPCPAVIQLLELTQMIEMMYICHRKPLRRSPSSAAEISRSSAAGARRRLLLDWRSRGCYPPDRTMGCHDVFLSYNSKDREAVRRIGVILAEKGLRVWLDILELIPGRRWQNALEETIESTRATAIFFGANGIGRWQELEIRACVDESVHRSIPVIPVILPDAPASLVLPKFLSEFTWVDLRACPETAGLERLVWGITGCCPVADSNALSFKSVPGA